MISNVFFQTNEAKAKNSNSKKTNSKDAKNKMTNKSMICNIDSANCSTNENTKIEEINLDQSKKVKLIYYTDPICSACWAIEPNVRKFVSEYGQYFELEYRMGGLLANWNGFSDASNGISSPRDVAPHWDEVGQESGMSIDGDIWYEDPLHSSYPPSIAFYAAKIQSESKAKLFLRKLREKVFLYKQNICKDEVLMTCAKESNLDLDKFKGDYLDSSKAYKLFQNDLIEAQKMSIRGFPTFIFTNQSGKGLKLSGSANYNYYIQALEKALDEKINKSKVIGKKFNFDNLKSLLSNNQLLASIEIARFFDESPATIEQKLNEFQNKNLIRIHKFKFSNFWTLQN